MDRIWTRHFRISPPSGDAPATAAGPAPGPDLRPPEPQAVKSRLLPVDAGAGPARLRAVPIAKATVAGLIGQGGCFGLAFALSNHLRVRSNPAVAGVAGLMVPVMAGYLTAPAQRAMFEALDFRSTQPPARARWHEAIPSVCIYAVNVLYAQARFVPRPVPGTAGAAATTLLLSMAATALSGALCEASAQWVGGRPDPIPDDGEVRRIGTGRGLSLVPMGLANLRATAYTTHFGRVPEGFRMRPLQIGLVGWAILRKDLIPPDPEGGQPHAPPAPPDA